MLKLCKGVRVASRIDTSELYQSRPTLTYVWKRNDKRPYRKRYFGPAIESLSLQRKYIEPFVQHLRGKRAISHRDAGPDDVAEEGSTYSTGMDQ